MILLQEVIMKFYKKVLSFGLIFTPILADDWSTAFPTGGWTTCAKEKGYIDIQTILRLAQSDPVKVNKNLAIKQNCAQDSSNVNFRSAIQMACQRSMSTPVNLQEIITLCNTVGIKLAVAGGATQSVLGNAPGNLNMVQTKKLLSTAFPAPMFSTSCTASHGALNFDAITALAQMPTAQSDLSSKISDVTKCLTPSNPNFIANVSQSCRNFQNSPSRDKLIQLRPDVAKMCSDIGAPLNPNANQNPYAQTQQQDNNAKIDAMFKKAFPTDGVTNCTAGRGKLDFDTIAELTGLPIAQGFLTQKLNAVKQCISPSNPNFINNLKGSCQSLKTSASLNTLSSRPDVLELCAYAGVPVNPAPTPTPAPTPAPAAAPVAPAPATPTNPTSGFLAYFQSAEQDAQNEINALNGIKFINPKDILLQEVVDENLKIAKERHEYFRQVLSGIQG
ncbi:MAG: hypothetical protein NEHIOOID_00390 [Holosporales bacterium]